MPAEKFWNSATTAEDDRSEPALTIAWHGACQCGESFVSINGVKFDTRDTDRIIKTLRRARKKAAAVL